MSCASACLARATCCASSAPRSRAAPKPPSLLGRRAALSVGLGVLGGAVSPFPSRDDADALPLAPLGAVKSVGGAKRVGLSADEVAAILKEDLVTGQYFVTGNLTREVFDDNCRFKDPTNDVKGLSRYLTALGLLFDPKDSFVRLTSISVTSPTTVETDGTLEGYLRFPWHPRVDPYEFHTTYTLDPTTGLIVDQSQTWSISGAKALAETFTPTLDFLSSEAATHRGDE